MLLVSKMDGISKFGRDNILSMFVNSSLSLSNDSMASSDSCTFLSVLFKCLFNGAAILENIFMNFR